MEREEIDHRQEFGYGDRCLLRELVEMLERIAEAIEALKK